MKIFLLFLISTISITNSFHQRNNKKNKIMKVTHYQNNIISQNKSHNGRLNISMLDVIASCYIVSNAFKKKIIIEVVNDSFMLQTLDNLHPLYILILMISSTFSLNSSKYNKKIDKLRNKNTRQIYRWVDFSIIVSIIILMKNVKNAI
jgi:uncharacterized protein YggT (Ycf19 family)